MTGLLLQLSAVTKDYRGLRPLRIEHLEVASGDQLAIVGLDRPASEVFINLVTGATLPDRGEISAFGRPTAAIQDSDDWFTTLDRFGIVSERAVLLDALSVTQNLAVPFSLEIEPPPDAVRSRVQALAGVMGLDAASWDRPVADLDLPARLRVRFARAGDSVVEVALQAALDHRILHGFSFADEIKHHHRMGEQRDHCRKDAKRDVAGQVEAAEAEHDGHDEPDDADSDGGQEGLCHR